MARPGPSPKLDPTVMRPLTEALLAMKQVTFFLPEKGRGNSFANGPSPMVSSLDTAPIWWQMTMMLWRSVPAIWRIDRMSDVHVIENGASIPAGFDIKAFAKRSFWCLP